MHTTQIISLAFALAGYSMAQDGSAAAAPSGGSTELTGSSGSDGPLVPGSKFTHYCEDPSNYSFTDMDVEITPEMPEPGTNATISITGTLKNDITEGTQQRVTIGKIEGGEEKVLFTNSRDVCAGIEMIPDALDAKPCPIEAGPFEWTHDFQIPELPPMPELPDDFEEKFEKAKADAKEKLDSIDPKKIEEARAGMEDAVAGMREKMREGLPKGEFFFRGQTINAQGEVLSCIYRSLDTEGAAGNGTEAA
ncbi:hypothetical protein MBLNU230_g8450t1 [Neophaeotheca triangularis]